MANIAAILIPIASVMIVLMLIMILCVFLYRRKVQLDSNKIKSANDVVSECGFGDDRSHKCTVMFDKKDGNIISDNIKVILHDQDGKVVCNGIVNLKKLCNSSGEHTKCVFSFKGDRGITSLFSDKEKEIWKAGSKCEELLQKKILDSKSEKEAEPGAVQMVFWGWVNPQDALKDFIKFGKLLLESLDHYPVAEDSVVYIPDKHFTTTLKHLHGKDTELKGVEGYKKWFKGLLENIEQDVQSVTCRDDAKSIMEKYGLIHGLKNPLLGMQKFANTITLKPFRAFEKMMLKEIETLLPKLAVQVERDAHDGSGFLVGPIKQYTPKGVGKFKFALEGDTEEKIKGTQDSLCIDVRCVQKDTSVGVYNALADKLHNLAESYKKKNPESEEFVTKVASANSTLDRADDLGIGSEGMDCGSDGGGIGAD